MVCPLTPDSNPYSTKKKKKGSKQTTSRAPHASRVRCTIPINAQVRSSFFFLFLAHSRPIFGYGLQSAPFRFWPAVGPFLVLGPQSTHFLFLARSPPFFGSWPAVGHFRFLALSRPLFGSWPVVGPFSVLGP
jgi:hypothetical protein